MRVLVWTPTAQEIPGGHRVQLDNTTHALRAAGVEVQRSSDEIPPMEGIDLVHGYGLSTSQVRHLRLRGVPVCLSTIYCSRRWSLGLDQRVGGEFQLARRIRLAATLAVAGMRLRHADKAEALIERTTAARMALESADMLLPNSPLEEETLRRELGVTTPAEVVPNGVSAAIFGQELPNHVERDDDVVLYVGRFEPHKNQLGLIRALRRRPYRLILVGPPHPHHPEYFQRCQREARADVEFIGDTTQDELVSLYRRARVHVLPSWYETTGLVSLEAAALGCNIVSTDRGYARSYLGDDAWYCDPGRRESIGSAVDDAMRSPTDPSLRERVLTDFTWQRAAEATIRGYERALSAQGPRRSTP